MYSLFSVSTVLRVIGEGIYYIEENESDWNLCYPLSQISRYEYIAQNRESARINEGILMILKYTLTIILNCQIFGSDFVIEGEW